MWRTANAGQTTRQLGLGARQASHVVAASRKQKPQKPRLRKKNQAPIDQRIFMDMPDEFEEDEEAPVGMTSRVPMAPPTASRRAPEVLPEDIYPVFAKPASAVTRMAKGKGGAWSWDDADARPEEPVMPEWNPKTGFMRTRAQVEAEAAAQNAMASSSNSSSSSSDASSLQQRQASSSQASTSAAKAAAPQSGSGLQPLPSVSRGEVLKSCAGLSSAFVVIALLIRAYAQQNAAAAMGTDPQLLQTLLSLPSGLGGEGRDAAVLLAAAGGVTAARYALTAAWPAFKEATDRSNQQVLAPLGWPDVVLVALLSGTSEELLFRGALIPASFPDWRGVLFAGVLFGLLHNSGGRNAAFAAWASGVGCLYGAAYLYTGNIWVPAGAHALANFASAAVWLSRSKGSAASDSSISNSSSNSSVKVNS